MRLRSLAATAVIIASAACSGPSNSPQQSARTNTMTVVAPANYTEHSYRGKPDLGLTLALVEAGGGASHFKSDRLFSVLAGRHAGYEAAKLQKLYGKARMDAFMQTFTYSVHDLLTLFAVNHIALPAHPRISPSDGRALSIALYHAGVMPTGKYDCGYFMERLMTHPIHIVLMHDINQARGHGPAHNANFHLIMTRMVADLRNIYTNNGKTAQVGTRVQRVADAYSLSSRP